MLHIHRKLPVIVSFLVQLQARRLTALRKRNSVLDLFFKFVKFYRILFGQKKAERLLPISSNISHISLALLAINQLSHSWLGPLQRAVCKQFTMFVSKMFKITKVEGNNFCGWGRRNEQKRVFSRRVTRSEILGKTHKKTPVQESFFSLYAWNFVTKETPA